MRNLKKFLALVLALMMAMSLMVTANAAVTSNVTYDDDYQVEEAFEEAVTVLSGMNVIQGYNEGETFMPKSNITRAEAATLVYRLATGDVKNEKAYLYTDYALQYSLTDVTSDKWYAGAVGYCANFGIVKGRSDGLFHANDPVTGYEILAMILRVVGYDKNGEFSGADWAYNVSTLATSLGVLDQVKTANYNTNTATNLYGPASREVVASLLFETVANVPKVVYSPALGYSQYGISGGVLGNQQNDTVGYEVFGLAYNYGVVVGNQATGEKVTKLGFSLPDGYFYRDNTKANSLYINTTSKQSAYVYESDSTGYDNVTIDFKWESGLESFGHAKKVWYNAKSSNTLEWYGPAGRQRSARTNLDTYAMLDESVQTKVVTLDVAGDGTIAAANAQLGKAASGEKFTLRKDSSGNNAAYLNYAFAPTTANDFADTKTDFESPILVNNGSDPHQMYLLISNSDDKALDMIVALDLTITQIAQENNVKLDSTVGVYSGNDYDSTDGFSGTAYFGVSSDRITSGVDSSKIYTEIAQDNLVGDSATKRDTKVAAIEITGTTGTEDGITTPAGNADAVLDSTYYYQLTELKKVVPATVVNVNYDTQEVFLSDGSSLKRSIFALAVDGTFKDSQYVKAPTVFTTYNFTLDSEGKYIYWEPITSTTNFVYGTYLDYETIFTSSSYTYKMVGVDSNGQQTIPEVTGYSLITDPTGILSLATGTNYSNNALPKRDSDYYSGRMLYGRYIGYTLSDGKLKEVTTEAGIKGDGSDVWGGLPEQPMIKASAIDFGRSSTTITPNDALVGSVKVSNDPSVPAVSGDKDLFLTNDTMIYVVSGAGTDSQKVVPYKGLAELTKDCRSVVIKGSTGVDDTPILCGDWNGDGTADITYADMIYYKQHDFGYAQSYVYSAKAADVVYIPADAITFNKATSSSLYFVGDSDSKVVNATGEVATLFTVYQNGEAVQRWISGDVRSSGDAKRISDNGDNVFYDLINTGKKTSNNQDIYSIAPVADISSDPKAADGILIGQFWADNGKDGKGDVVAATTNPGGLIASKVAAIYSATTYSLQSAFIDPNNHYSATELYNVSNAIVKNLDEDTYPGIKDLSTLHQAGSLYDNEGVQVSCVLGEGYRNVTYIYVNANQF